MKDPDTETLPIITRGEQRALERLFAASFNLMNSLRGFVRNRHSIIASEDIFDSPLERLFNQSEAALEAAGFWPEDYEAAEADRESRSLLGRPARVIIESPYAGRITANVAYARQAMRDSLLHHEYPIASHLLYPQPGVLDDDKPAQRRLGIEAGLAWRKVADKAVFYTGMGWSQGMREARALYDDEGFPYELRDMAPLPLSAPYPSNMPFPADPFGLADRHEGLFDGERFVSPEELAPLEVQAEA
jgi:hypothetical protein